MTAVSSSEAGRSPHAEMVGVAAGGRHHTAPITEVSGRSLLRSLALDLSGAHTAGYLVAEAACNAATPVLTSSVYTLGGRT